MKLTQTEEFLIDGLRLFDLTEEEQLGIFLALRTEKQQALMMDYLAYNRKASGEDILKKTVEILMKT